MKYAKTRPVFEAYKAAGYSRKFLAEHEAELAIYRAARTDFQRLLNGAKLPKMDKLKEEGRKLTDRKKALYADYQEVKRDMQEVLAAKANIDLSARLRRAGEKQETGAIADGTHKEQSDATTSGQLGPKHRVWGRLPNKQVYAVSP